MGTIDWILLIVIGAAVAGAAVYWIRKKKCGCDCGCCGASQSCQRKKENR